jgi:hypothetical protein
MNKAALASALELSCLMNRLVHGRLQLGVGERAALRATIVRAIAALGGADVASAERLDVETGRAAFLALTEALAAAGIPNATMVTWFNDTAFERVKGEHHAGIG